MIAGDDADEEDARLENGINADEMLFPTLVSDIAVDADANIWFLNGSNSILGYVTSEISSVTANQDVTYRLYWERVRDLEARGNMVLDPVSGDFYLVQTNQHRVVRIDAESGKITPVAGTGRQGFDGDGKALEVALNQPSDIARDGLGNFYITDTGNHLIRKLTPDGKLITIAGQYVLDTYVDDSDEDNEDDVPSYEPIGETTGDGGQARLARVDTPREISAEADGTVYFTSESRTIRRIDNDLIDNYVGSGIEGYNGTGFRADLIHLDETGDLAIGPDGLLYFIDNLRIRRVRFDGSFWIVEDIAGSGRERDLHDSLLDPLKADLRPTSLDFDAFGNLYVYDAAHRRLRMLEHHNGSNED